MFHFLERLNDFADWANVLKLTISEVFSGGYLLSVGDSPGTRRSAAHLLSRRIRNSTVNLVVKALRPHDMPMAPYTTSRLRRSAYLIGGPVRFEQHNLPPGCGKWLSCSTPLGEGFRR